MAVKTNGPVKTGDSSKKSSRKQMSTVLDIDMSTSRARNYLDKYNINADVESALAELRAKKAGDKKALSAKTESLVKRAYDEVYTPRKERHDSAVAKAKGNAKKLKELGDSPVKNNTVDEQIDYVSKLRWRFSNDSKIVLATALDFVIQKLAESAMVNARNAGKAIIHLRHVFEGDCQSMAVYPLVDRLAITQDVLSAENKDDEEDVDDGDDKDNDNPFDFKFYIQQKCKRVKTELTKKNETYNRIRISSKFKEDCSEIVVQLIKRLSPLIELFATTSDIKTVNDKVIMFVFKMILLDSGVCCKEFDEYINGRVKMYHEHTAKK